MKMETIKNSLGVMLQCLLQKLYQRIFFHISFSKVRILRQLDRKFHLVSHLEVANL